ncbi:ryncolin-1-like isoform X1 [Orbicella faveolata]|uniref:ryncolin-1-like isoform X1 n=1 Tax=Orbicella faveolata TaxID=48498 RepID=UPI0009E65D3D|nr:ryncolin-1-like isoform X1 [Orbicella faveolata]
MTSLLWAAFGWSVLFVAISVAKPTDPSPSQLAQKSKHAPSMAADDKQDKRSFVINGNYYACPNWEMETLLRGIQAQLSEMQKQQQAIKPVTKNETAVMRDCADVFKAGETISGVYTINPDNGDSFDVYCDQKTTGGGWTVIQKRLDGSVDFYRGWADYKRGFGNLNGEFWLGLDKMHGLTKEGRNRIRFDLEDIEGNTAYAEYDMIAVASERAKYQLSLGAYTGTAGDSFGYQRGAPFSTKDQDNDPDARHCAVTFKGGWWYSTCRHSNLNGLYHHGTHKSRADGINWYHWKGDYYSAKRSEIKIRPADFEKFLLLA